MKLNKIIWISAIVMIMVLSVACNNNVSEYKQFIGKTGIVVKEDFSIENLSDKDPESIDLSNILIMNDLLLVLDVKDNYFKVIMPYGDVPRPIGYVPINSLSFDENKLKEGNQGELKSANIYDAMNGKMIGTRDGVGLIEERDGDWALFQLPGGEEPFWVKLSDISYDLSSQYPE